MLKHLMLFLDIFSVYRILILNNFYFNAFALPAWAVRVRIIHLILQNTPPRYLAAFAYRFNRRFQLDTLPMRLLVATTIGPRPADWLRLAEVSS